MSLPFRSGQRLSATELNRTLSRIDALERGRTAAGSNARVPMLVVALVTAVRHATLIAGGSGEVDLRPVLYDLLPMGASPEGTIRDVSPWLGRPWASVAGTMMATGVPASIGDQALIIRVPDGEGAFANLVILPEFLVAGPVCDTQQGA